MSIKLDEHGFQLVCMKIYATLWNWIDLNPNKRVNITLPNGETRAFVADGDEIILRATASAPGRVAIGLGECRAMVMAS